MTILILENVPAAVRGELSRWMIEPAAGVFVGVLSAMVRDRVWQMVQAKVGEDGRAILLYSTNTEQGFCARTSGVLNRQLVDFEGIQLVRAQK